jgi:hypothetical protein
MSVLDELDAMEIPQLPVKPVTPATPNPLHAQWMRWRPMFEEAMSDGLYSIGMLERSIGQGRSIFFPGKNAALVGEKVSYHDRDVFQVLWCVGDLEEAVGMAPGVEAMARSLGCAEMLIEGRKGWERVLKPMGYEPWSVTVRKAL